MVLSLVAVEDGVTVEDVSLWSVRYRLVDPQQLNAALAALLPGSLDHVATTVADGRN
ncbi:hypothetical protein [Streptomyces turgidiscabies]|uniref:Uncharacterized protein n=1 Tax=Streptomyces turgidiscabies TaxID=85558 RepID=A0ABU0S1I7_9ACTN|nr:hypothetical protein [Streptomyces turgidiscabies]MDQ0938071.1 hypothetical protein [Streptomyces turgidiscabies]